MQTVRERIVCFFVFSSFGTGGAAKKGTAHDEAGFSYTRSVRVTQRRFQLAFGLLLGETTENIRKIDALMIRRTVAGKET